MRYALAVCLVLVNAAAFVLYAVDKRRAQRHMWRVPEATLLIAAALGGSLGALLAIHLLRHKTNRPKFTVLVPTFLLIHTAVFAYLFWRIS